MKGAKELTSLLLIVLLSIATPSYGEVIILDSIISPISSLSVKSGEPGTSISTSIDNNIPNAMIWCNVTFSNISSTQSQLLFKPSLYYYDNSGNQNFLFAAVLSNNNASMTAYRFAYSTCPNQYSVATQENMDVGDKLGIWNWTFTDIKPTLDYDVSIAIGAQSGVLLPFKNYSVLSIPVPVMYFNIDLSTFSNASSYLLTINLYSTTPTGLSFLRGIVARSKACPVFTYDFELVNNDNQDYMMATTPATQLTQTFGHPLPAEPTYLAVEMTKDAVNVQGLVISWSAVAAPFQYTDDSDSDTSTTQWTTLAIVLAVFTGLLVIAVIALVAVIGFLGVKYVKPQYQAI